MQSPYIAVQAIPNLAVPAADTRPIDCRRRSSRRQAIPRRRCRRADQLLQSCLSCRLETPGLARARLMRFEFEVVKEAESKRRQKLKLASW